jgi:hypothetical protein
VIRIFKKSAGDDNFFEELQEISNITDNNEFNEEKFYENLDFGNEAHENDKFAVHAEMRKEFLPEATHDSRKERRASSHN